MNKRIANYLLRTRNQDWPKSLADAFHFARGKYGGFHFDVGSDEDQHWQREVARLGLDVDRKTMILCTGRDLYCHPYHCLTVTEDRDYLKPEVMDKSDMCPGDSSTLCRTGVRQIAKLQLDPTKSKSVDIMWDSRWLKPNVITVSPKLKRLLEADDVTGCRFVPCLDSRKNYSPEEMRFPAHPGVLDEDAVRFQVLVTASVINPKRLGRVRRLIEQCSVCGAVYRWDSEEYGYFQSDDLADVDFQKYDSYQGSNGVQFVTAMESVVISSRVLKLMHEAGVRGLQRFLVDPPVKHGVEDVRD